MSTTASNSIRGAVATRDQRQSPQAGGGIASFIASLLPEIARALPKHLDPDRLARLALTEVRKNPKLANCDPASFAGALLTAAALGLEVGVNGEAYLVPYGKECQFIVGYQGLVKLFWQHPLAAHIDAQAVYEHDDFDYAYGLNPFLTHKPALGGPKARGQVIAYYGVAKLTTGAGAFLVLSPEEVKELRGGKSGASGSIKDPQRWMERKTVLRQLVKTLPKSTTMNRAIDADDMPGSTLQNRRVISEQLAPAPTSSALPAGVDPGTGEAGPTYVHQDTSEYVDAEMDDLEPEGDF